MLGATILLTLTSLQRGTISGHVYRCDPAGSPAARACAPGEPISGIQLRFEQVGGGRSFVVPTDSTGAYTVQVDPGTYIAKWEITGTGAYNDAGHVYLGDWGIKPFSIKPRQHLVLDLATHSLTQ